NTVSVGATLGVDKGAWTTGTTFKYQWYANGKAISKATKATYKLTSKEAGKAITVKVTGSKSGYATVSLTSAVTEKVITSPTPKITGSAIVGSTLKVSRGTWTKSVGFTYQWTADGVDIAGATGTSFVVTADEIDKQIRVKVTGTLAGYPTVIK